MTHLNIDDVKKLYGSLESKYQEARKRFDRPLTLTEKILTSHLAESAAG